MTDASGSNFRLRRSRGFLEPTEVAGPRDRVHRVAAGDQSVATGDDLDGAVSGFHRDDADSERPERLADEVASVADSDRGRRLVRGAQ
jgi:hypothetical protein